MNYANPDTIAHTADYDASLEAVRVIDHEIERVLHVAINPDTLLFITSDHGNIEEMVSPVTGLPESQHDPSPVPFYMAVDKYRGRKFVNADDLANETLGSLADIAPTILEAMGMAKPTDMSGRSLLDELV